MPTTLANLAELTGGEVFGNADTLIDRARSMEKAEARDITFATDPGKLEVAHRGTAAAIVVSRSLAGSLPLEADSRSYLLVDDAFLGFLQILDHFAPQPERAGIGVSDQALIADDCVIGGNTNIFPQVVIGSNVEIGENCDIHPGVVIISDVKIGDNTIVYPNVVIYQNTTIGKNCIIHASAVLGTDGFGYRMVNGAHQKIPHYGCLRVEDDVEIGAGTTIDRAMMDETVIGQGTKLDSQVMVAHNCIVGPHNAYASQTGLAGSVVTGSHVICAGQVGIADHVTIGDRAILGAQCGVPKDLPGDQTYLGSPCDVDSQAIRSFVNVRRIDEIRAVQKKLVKQIAKLEAQLESLCDNDPICGNDPNSAAA